MTLFKLTKKKNLKPEKNHTEDLQHLTESGDLPWGWIAANHEFIEKVERQNRVFLNAWVSSFNKSPRDQVNALASFVKYMEDVKKLCESKGECFSYWCNNILFTQDYIEKRTAELEKLRKQL